MSGHVSLEIPAELEKIQQVSDDIEGCMKTHGWEENAVLDVQLAVEEAVTNTIQHGYRGTSGTIAIRIETTPHHITVEITDDAPAFNPLLVPEPDTSADLKDRQVGGLGIFLIRQVMDEVTYRYEQNKNILVLEKKIGL